MITPMPNPQQFQFNADKSGERLDKMLVTRLGEQLTRSQIQTLIKDGLVTVNGEPVKAGLKLKGGETIAVTIPPPAQDRGVEPEDIPLDVIYEDADLAVINKPAGLIVHPGSGNETGTLVNAILSRYPEVAQISHAPKRRGIVHRLDKDTSGLIVVARNALAMRRLMEQFQRRAVEKTYIALLERTPKTTIGRITAPIDRDPVHRKQMAVSREGRPAITEFSVVERFRDGKALVRVNLLTGRTHQIRVHMAFIDCPIVGDRVYGFRKQRLLERQFLHAARLCFDHPSAGERLCFEAPLPQDLENLLAQLRRHTP
jgi:23S rRNA pseudouridine1911/1915/1917 synthase